MLASGGIVAALVAFKEGTTAHLISLKVAEGALGGAMVGFMIALLRVAKWL